MYEEIDKENMYSLLFKFPDDFVKAYNLSKETLLPTLKTILIEHEFDKVVVLGMGGSGIAGEIAVDLFYDKINVPILSVKDFKLPLCALENSLVFSISYSGNTYETLRATKRVIQARNNFIIGVTSNGELERMLNRKNYPVVKIPTGYPPRCAISYLTMPLIVILSTLSRIDMDEDIKYTYSQLIKMRENIRREVRENKNLAKAYAKKILGKIPLIYSYRPYCSVAVRFKDQLNENSKMLAKFDHIPEMNHNDIMLFEAIQIEKEKVLVAILRGSEEDLDVRARIDYLKRILEKENIDFIEISVKSGKRLSEIFEMIYLTDLISYYLAIYRSIDPTPVHLISDLKKYLAQVRQKLGIEEQ